MTAILLTVLFAGTAMLALGVICASWRAYAPKFAAVREELRSADYQVGVTFRWRDSAAPQASALIYQLKFTPRAESLPFHPELVHELRAAA